MVGRCLYCQPDSYQQCREQLISKGCMDKCNRCSCDKCNSYYRCVPPWCWFLSEDGQRHHLESATDAYLAWDNADVDCPVAGDGIWMVAPRPVCTDPVMVLSQDGQWQHLESSDRCLSGLGQCRGGSSDHRRLECGWVEPRPVYRPGCRVSISRWTMAAPGMQRPIAIWPGTMPWRPPVAGRLECGWPDRDRCGTDPAPSFISTMDHGSTWNPGDRPPSCVGQFGMEISRSPETGTGMAERAPA